VVVVSDAGLIHASKDLVEPQRLRLAPAKQWDCSEESHQKKSQPF
jgi:hypothetical protein